MRRDGEFQNLPKPVSRAAGPAKTGKRDRHDMRLLLVAVALMMAGTMVQAQGCGDLCDRRWWAEADQTQISTAIADADPAGRDTFGATALHYVAWFGSSSQVGRLLAAGADPNARDEQGWCPLNWAAAFGEAESVSLLIAAGADVNARDVKGWSSLHWAAGLGTPETIIALIDAGADTDARDATFGWAPLHEAAGNGTPENVMTLLRAGADGAVMNHFGISPIDLAKKNDKVSGTEAFRLLLAARAQ